MTFRIGLRLVPPICYKRLGASREVASKGRGGVPRHFYIGDGGRAMTTVETDLEQPCDHPLTEDEARELQKRIGAALARGYDDLVHGRVRPWAQAKQDAERIRASRKGD